MYKIQTLNKISSRGLNLLPHDNYEVASEFANPDGIILRSFKMHDMELPRSLKAIARAGAGVNNIPIEKCSQKGIVVFNTPGANANAVKELVLAGMLLASRDIIGGVNWAQSIKDKENEVPALIEKGKADFAGCELRGKKLGVVGLGAIGAMVANDALSLGMEVIGYDPYLSVEAAWSLSSEVQKASGLESLLKEVDYLTIHVPLLDSTKGMYNAEKFAMMKNGVKIMNFARGELINNEDIKAALKSGKVGAYVTDFPTAELLGVKGVIPVPHLGASTEESEENCAMMAAQQLKNFLETGNIKNSVNFPNCELEKKEDKKRIIIANKNIPNMISLITTLLAENNINIYDMLNKSKQDIAYNIIDTDDDVSNDILEKILGINGILMAKVLD
ncbi:MAG TPA: 3-phosphoglycerate dehydrogenase [Sulfurospirillum sp. UBA12182]|jgi:D-3-phosphoglycerate dehydrogenase|nr:MAG TPA: 3-phosphoglycerate dehydrogenase [Sulfurospirillum sp. UBA12182]